MDLLQQSAQAWKEITEYRYLFTYGYKKQLYPINLTFSLEDYPHLAGFQYMKDISLPNYSSAKIADRILEGKIQWANAKNFIFLFLSLTYTKEERCFYRVLEKFFYFCAKKQL